MAGAFAALSTMVTGVFGGHGQAVMPHAGDNGQYTGTTTGMMRGQFNNAVHGTVTGISGNIITVNGAVGTTTALSTYTIDATNAKIMKGTTTTSVTIASVTTGDTLTVSGTVTGTNVAATLIYDGQVPQGMMNGGFGKNATTTRGELEGGTIGHPMHAASGIMGTVSAISGNSLTVLGHSVAVGTSAASTFTVDATNAKILKSGSTSATVASIAVGDRVMVQGTVSGASVTAQNIIDGVGFGMQGGRGGVIHRPQSDTQSGGDQ